MLPSSFSALAYECTVDDICYNLNNDDKTASVTYIGLYSSNNKDAYVGNIVIPESTTYNGTIYSVTSIGGYAFDGCSGLTSVTIPNSVTSIGDRAFSGCSSLTSVTVDKNNGTYDSRNNCNAIIETSTNNLIVGCKNTTIPNSVTSIGDRAFADCSGLTSVTIGEKVTKISSSAFSGCSGLTSVTFNAEKCIKMGDYYDPVFRDCTNLKSLTIGNKVTTIPDYAFFRCSGLTSVTIGNSVNSIGVYAFRGCSGLTSVTIPNSVTSIGDRAFGGCSGLTSVTIGNSVTSIGRQAFADCSGLTSIVIPNSVTSIGSSAFDGCSGLTSVTFNAEKCIKMGSYDSFVFSGRIGLTSLTIGEKVTTIPDWAFTGCSGLTSVIIPNSVTSIGEYAFYNCSGLTSVTVDKNNGTYDSRNNCNAIIETSTNNLIVGCKNTIIPNSVTSIGESAFYNCSGPTSVTIDPISVHFSALNVTEVSPEQPRKALLGITVTLSPIVNDVRFVQSLKGVLILVQFSALNVTEVSPEQ